MEDPIIKRIKEEGRSKRAKAPEQRTLTGSIDQIFLPARENSGQLQKLYMIGNPIHTLNPDQTPYGRPGLKELEIAVERVNEGQKQLEVIKKIERSELYKGMITLSDGLLGLFGRRPDRFNDIYGLFEHQQHNVRDLNHILAAMGRSYDENVKNTRADLDGLLVKTQREIERRKVMEQDEIPPEIRRYDNAISALKDKDRYKDPSSYFSALQEVIDAKRVSRQKRFEFITTSMGEEHHSLQIDKLMMQEELFETMLYRVMEMAFKTELYQETLDRDIPLWRSTRDLFEAVKAVSGSMLILESYNRDLNETYLRAISEITRMVDGHRGARLIESANQDMRRMITDVNASFYRNASQYEQRK
ncbi:MAG TPA: hypothetical protein VJI46_04185 [Candidatus Nanoarchaeia archaeon]|nr:hypothetical protein [Candidatus Nanoarchaeia archaeon]